MCYACECRNKFHSKRVESILICWVDLQSITFKSKLKDLILSHSSSCSWSKDKSCFISTGLCISYVWTVDLINKFSFHHRKWSYFEHFADMWKQIVGTPSMDGLVRRPDLLSFYIASKIPVSESTRQELLEIDGISYRLQREIDLLKSFDLIRCKYCQVTSYKCLCLCTHMHAYISSCLCLH